MRFPVMRMAGVGLVGYGMGTALRGEYGPAVVLILLGIYHELLHQHAERKR